MTNFNVQSDQYRNHGVKTILNNELSYWGVCPLYIKVVETIRLDEKVKFGNVQQIPKASKIYPNFYSNCLQASVTMIKTLCLLQDSKEKQTFNKTNPF